MLAGNVVALLSPCVFVPLLTFGAGADDYDYASMRAIRRGDDGGDGAAAAHADAAQLDRAAFVARLVTAIMTLALLVLWPMPMYGAGYVFSRKFFAGWVAVGIL